MRRWSFVSLLCLPVGVSAEERLTEGEFLAVLRETHPAFRAIAGDLGSAKAERLRAGFLDDPRLEVSREDPDGVSRETTWGVAWTPPIDGRRRWAIRAAEGSQ